MVPDAYGECEQNQTGYAACSGNDSAVQTSSRSDIPPREPRFVEVSGDMRDFLTSNAFKDLPVTKREISLEPAYDVPVLSQAIGIARDRIRLSDNDGSGAPSADDVALHVYRIKQALAQNECDADSERELFGKEIKELSQEGSSTSPLKPLVLKTVREFLCEREVCDQSLGALLCQTTGPCDPCRNMRKGKGCKHGIACLRCHLKEHYATVKLNPSQARRRRALAKQQKEASYFQPFGS